MSVGGVSFTMVRARDLYPRKSLLFLDRCPDGGGTPGPPFCPLPGEDILYLGAIQEGVVAALSNYRLFVDASPRINLPLGLLEALELRDLSCVALHTKDGRSARFECHSPANAEEWLRRISSLSNPSSLNLEDGFAFAHAAWHAQEASLLLQEDEDSFRGWFHGEIARLRFDIQGAWRISSANKDYKLCGTYPEELLIPFCISDAMLEKIAQFRSAQRITAILWRHQISGAVLARCSQPEVGWLGWRSTEDEQMVKALADACAWDRGNVQPLSSSDEEEETHSGLHALENGSSSTGQSEAPQKETQKKVLIIDARSYAAAFGNRARGGGVECPEYYPNTEIEFMSLANIHYIRKSFHALRSLVNSNTADPASWFGALDGTKWLSHMAGLLKAAVRVTTALEVEGRPVIVHCSDGWDRTPQIVSLAQLLLDPHYRTVTGFRVLVEKEWLDFGHKMADRCGLPGCSSDPNERSPIFLQWLDCVHQLLLQFPCSFEFNTSYLVKLAQHTYSSLFGTFLCNNQQERRINNVPERTRSVWTYLNDHPEQFVNFLYKSQEETLWPRCEVRDLSLWKSVYVSSEARIRFPVESSSGDSSADGSEVEGSESVLVKESASCQIEEASHNGGTGIVDTSTASANGIHENSSNSSSSAANGQSEEVLSLSNVIESSTDTLVPEDSSKNSHLSEEAMFPLDADGLFSHRDSVQSRLAEIDAAHRSQIRSLEQELYQARVSLRRLLQKNTPGDSKIAPPEEDLEEATQSGSTTSDLSWEAVDEKETKPTLWVPDHAGAVCMGCNSRFWFGRRKHHCRSCGLLFCNNCSAQFSPLPTEQLYSPVRVCDECFSALDNSEPLHNNAAAAAHQHNNNRAKSAEEDESGEETPAEHPKIPISSPEGVIVEQLC